MPKRYSRKQRGHSYVCVLEQGDWGVSIKTLPLGQSSFGVSLWLEIYAREMLAFSAPSTSVCVWERPPATLPKMGKRPINSCARVGEEVLDKETPRYSRLRILWCVSVQLLHLEMEFWISANCHGRKSAPFRQPLRQPISPASVDQGAACGSAGTRAPGRAMAGGCGSALGPKPPAERAASPGLTPPWKRPALPGPHPPGRDQYIPAAPGG